MRRLVLHICLLSLVVGHSPAHSAEVTARELLSRLSVASEAGSSTYERSKFQHWIDADGDGCNTRAEVLQDESRVSVSYSSGCTVYKGRWYSWYDGKTWTYASDVDIDHVVALKEAWQSGARLWSSTDRKRFANDLGSPGSLDAVTDNVNQSKSDRDPADWLPSINKCRYGIRWVKVKYRWRLKINSGERSALSSLLAGSCGDKVVTVPRRAI